jgi:hypothetical protein
MIKKFLEPIYHSITGPKISLDCRMKNKLAIIAGNWVKSRHYHY